MPSRQLPAGTAQPVLVAGSLPVPAGPPLGWPQLRMLPLPGLTRPLNHAVACQPASLALRWWPGRGRDSHGYELLSRTDTAPTAWLSDANNYWRTSSILKTSEVASGVLHPVVGSPVQDRSWHTGLSPTKSCEDD